MDKSQLIQKQQSQVESKSSQLNLQEAFSNVYSYKSTIDKKYRSKLIQYKNEQSIELREDVKKEQTNNVQVELEQFEEKEFRKQTIQWNTFVLIYNHKYRTDTFLCGNCQGTFNRVVEFIYHCISLCGFICHPKSSHFIVNRKDWNIFLSSQIKKQYDLNKQLQSFMKTEKKQAQPRKAKFPSKQIKKQTCSVNFSENQINQFTQNIIKYWTQSELTIQFVFEQHYFTLYNIVFILNPCLQDYSHLKIETVSASCSKKYSNNMNWLKMHNGKKCCQVNTVDSRFLILNANMFYQYLVDTKRYILQKTKDLSFLVFLHQSIVLKDEVNLVFPRIKFYIPIIKIIYHLFNSPIIKCPSCLKQISVFEELHNLIIFDKHSEQCKKEYSYFQVIRSSANNKRKTINITFYYQLLQNYKFYCPCESFAREMNYDEFVDHIKENHKTKRLTFSNNQFYLS